MTDFTISKIKIIICDERRWADPIERAITSWSLVNHIRPDIMHVSNPNDLITFAESKPLDVNCIFMEAFYTQQSLNGIMITETIRNLGYCENIIFVSEKTELAVDSFMVGPLAFIPKPISKSKFEFYMDRH